MTNFSYAAYASFKLSKQSLGSDGMYFLYGYQGYQEITRITKSGKDIVQTLLESRELNANENYTAGVFIVDGHVVFKDSVARI